VNEAPGCRSAAALAEPNVYEHCFVFVQSFDTAAVGPLQLTRPVPHVTVTFEVSPFTSAGDANRVRQLCSD
jgi:hypothetical protein